MSVLWFGCGTAFGMGLGLWIASFCRDEEYKSQKKQIDLQEQQIEALREAATPIVAELLQAGEDTDWKNGPETERVYQWHEIESLAKALEALDD